MNINEISGAIIDCSMKIHKSLGPGLLESVNQGILMSELRKTGLIVEKEVPSPVNWDGHIIDESFRADLIINGQVLVELKSIERLEPAHSKQVLTYLKITKLPLGLLINFDAPYLKEGITRLVNNLPEDKNPPSLNP